MRFLYAKYLILGYQIASLKDLIFILRDKKKTVKFINSKYFKKKEIEKKIVNNYSNIFDKIVKLSNNYMIILGSSEKKLESNLANFFIKNKINFYYYLDSSTNLKKRFKDLISYPNNIIVINSLVKNKLKSEILDLKKNTNFFDLNMHYQKILELKYSKIKRTNSKILYLSSNLNIKTELKYINYLSKNFKDIKKIFIKLHPRDNLKLWSRVKFKDNRISINSKKNYFNDKNIKSVFGINTMALINFKFAGFNSIYFEIKSLNQSISDLYSTYKVKKFEFSFMN